MRVHSLILWQFASLVSADPADGYAKLITLFETLKTEASGNQKMDSTALAGVTESCDSELEGLRETIAKTSEDLADHTTKEQEAKDAVAAAEQALEEETAAKQASEVGLAALEASYRKNDARMTYDLGQLTAATTALAGASTQIENHAGLTTDKKAKLANMVKTLKGKMSDDMRKLDKEKTNGVTFYNENKQTMNDKILAHTNMLTQIGVRLSTQQGIFTQATGDKVMAQSDLNKHQTSKRDKAQSCKESQDALEASIKDATERVEALTAALSILEGSSKYPGKSDDASGAPAGFLQLRSNPTLLSQLQSAKSKMSVLKTALKFTASPQQVAVIKKIDSEIVKLLNTMHAQNQADEKDRSWCQQTENNLNQELTDARQKFDETKTKLEGLEAKAEKHDGLVKDAKKEINILLQDSVTDHKELTEDLDENKVELEQLNHDLSNLDQARIALANKFAGRTESAGQIVLEEVDKVLSDYHEAITVNKSSRRSLEAAVESTEKEYSNRLTQERSNQKRNEVQLENTSNKALKTEDLKRNVNTQVSTLQKTFDSIFTADDGKCKNYVDMFSSRKDARNAEMNNLNEAKKALAAYAESQGLRV